MKILIISLMISTMVIFGCSNQNQNRRFDRPSSIKGSRFSNLTEEQRQQMFEEMQRRFLEACQNKSEGDSCTSESQRGEIKGICKTQDENLVCTMDRSEGPLRQRIE